MYSHLYNRKNVFKIFEIRTLMKLQNMYYFGNFQLRSSDEHQTKHLAVRQANLNLLLIFG